MNNSIFRGRLFNFEVQHIFPLELRKGLDRNAQRARDFIQATLGFNLLDARSNKIPLLISAATRTALDAAPQAVQDVFKKAGFGLGLHDSQRSRPDWPEAWQQSLWCRLTAARKGARI